MPFGPFVLLTAAMVLVWSRRISSSSLAAWAWLIPAVSAVVMAAAVGVIEPSGVLLLVVLGVACRAAHAIVFVIATGLMLHALPGFHNRW